MKKICVIVTSRSTWGRLKSVIKAIKDHPKLQLQLIYACSFYNAQNEFEPDYRINALINGDDTPAMADTTGLLLTKVTEAYKQLRPDIVLVHGDRYEVLGAVVAASYMNIPVAHTEGGEDTGTIDQKVRYAITSLADIHFPVTEKARVKLIDSGIQQERVFVVGSTALDTAKQCDLTNNRNKDYVVILHHPNTTEPEEITPLIEAVNKLTIDKVWVNPNVDAGAKEMLKEIHKLDIEFVKDLPPEEYYRLLANCKCAIGNSSSFIKEGAYLGVSAVVVGDRQHNREHSGNVIFVENRLGSIILGIDDQINKAYKPSYMFGDGTAAQKIVEVLACI
jgi:UDP-hydrolysing UDP-N-acetyl-D-glucosamine 2-epimerase